MTDYLEIDSMPISQMTNGECVSYISEMLTYLPLDKTSSDPSLPEVQSAEPLAETGDATAVGISAELIAEMQECLDLLVDRTRESRSSTETAELEEVDRLRDEAVTYILNRVSGATTSPIADEREKATLMWNALKAYAGIVRLPVNDETGSIDGMLVDINRSEFSDTVTMLGISAAAAELKKLNDRYKQLVEQRKADLLEASKTGNSRVIRAKLSKLYKEMTDRAFAKNLLEPSEESAKFIERLNFLIDDTKKRLNMRGKRKDDEETGGSTDSGEEPGGTTDEGGENDDRPVVQ